MSVEASDCCLTPNEQFFSYIVARTSSSRFLVGSVMLMFIVFCVVFFVVFVTLRPVSVYTMLPVSLFVHS